MSATAVGERGETTIPEEVSSAAGLKAGDQVDWRFEEGEIRARKVEPAREPRMIMGKLVKQGDALVLEAEGVEIEPEAIAQAVREERDRH